VKAEHLARLSPIDDVRATAEYRRDAALTLVGRALEACAQKGCGGMRSEAKTEAAAEISFNLNGEFRAIRSDSRSRLSQVLARRVSSRRDKSRLRCRRLRSVHRSCQRAGRVFLPTAVGQLNGAKIETIEGLRASSPTFDRLQESFLQHGAAQCGICTPGMLVSSVALLDGNPCPDETQVMDAPRRSSLPLHGYRKIVRAFWKQTTVASGDNTFRE